MEKATIIVLAFQALVVLAAIGFLIYFIIQRIEKKKHETFEDRDN
jgi:hypothetical protein